MPGIRGLVTVAAVDILPGEYPMDARYSGHGLTDDVEGLGAGLGHYGLCFVQAGLNIDSGGLQAFTGETPQIERVEFRTFLAAADQIHRG